jgi:phosphoserine phosphatase RsbU/P
VCEIAIAVIEFSTSSATVIIGLVALPVLATAIICTPRQVAVAGSLATILVAVSAVWDRNFGTGQFAIRLIFVGVVSVLSIVVAVVLAERDAARAAQTFARGIAERRYRRADAARRAAEATIDALQEGLMPARVPDTPEWDVAARFHGGSEHVDVGGDFYVVVGAGRALAVIVGDVTGRGVSAAIVGTSVRHAARALAYAGHTPDEVVRAINDLLMANPAFTPVTMAGVWLTPADGGGCTATMICAGHPLPFVVRPNGAVDQAGHSGTLLGVFPSQECDWPVDTVRLAPEDMLFLYTDGVTDAGARRARFGEMRLQMVLADAPPGPVGLIDAVDAAVAAFAGPGDHGDDIAMLAVRRRGPSAPPGSGAGPNGYYPTGP